MNKHQLDGESSKETKSHHDRMVNCKDDIQTRSIKLDCPTFNGEDPNGWIYQDNQIFAFCNTPQQYGLKWSYST